MCVGCLVLKQTCKKCNNSKNAPNATSSCYKCSCLRPALHVLGLATAAHPSLVLRPSRSSGATRLGAVARTAGILRLVSSGTAAYAAWFGSDAGSVAATAPTNRWSACFSLLAAKSPTKTCSQPSACRCTWINSPCAFSICKLARTDSVLGDRGEQAAMLPVIKRGRSQIVPICSEA